MWGESVYWTAFDGTEVCLPVRITNETPNWGVPSSTNHEQNTELSSAFQYESRTKHRTEVRLPVRIRNKTPNWGVPSSTNQKQNTELRCAFQYESRPKTPNWGVPSSTNQKQKTEISETGKVAEFKIWKRFKRWCVLFCTEVFLRYESGVLNQRNKFLHCLFRASYQSKELAQDQQIHHSINYAHNRLHSSYIFWRYSLVSVCVLCALFLLTLAFWS